MTTDTVATPLNRIQMLILAFGMSAMGVSMTMNFVVVAPLAREAGLSEIDVAAILTLSAAFYAFCTRWWAGLSDKIGRKPVIVFSLAAAGVSNALFIVALNAALKGLMAGAFMIFVLAVVRLFFGLLSPGIHPAGMGLVAETTTPKDRAAGLGLLGAAMGFGSLVGPAAAIPLANMGAMAPLWANVILSLFAAGVVWAVLPKPVLLDASARPQPLKMRDERVRPYLLFLFSYFVAVGGVQQTIAFLMQDRFELDRQDSIQAAGVVFAIMSIATLVIQFGVVQRYKPDPRKMLKVGLCFVVLGYFIVALPGTFAITCAGFGCVGIGAALAVPGTNALASLSVKPAEQGSAAALMSMAPPAGFVIGPMLGALLYQIAPFVPSAISSVAIGVLTVFAFLRLTETNPESTR